MDNAKTHIQSRLHAGTTRGVLALRALCVIAISALCVSMARAQYNTLPRETNDVGVDDKIGEKLPLEIDLVDEAGQTVKLAEYFNFASRSGGRPVFIAMVYYDCPVACPAMIAKLNQALGQIDYVAGKDFNVVIVSFDPTNTTEQAREMREDTLRNYAKMATDKEPTLVADGWHFHTTTQENAERLADAIGFRYRYLASVDEYSHPTAAFIATPDGTVSTYFANMFSLAGAPRNAELALIEASDGKLARDFADKVASFCYRFDPKAGTAAFKAFRLMQFVGIVTMSGIALLIGSLRYYEARKNRALRRADASVRIGTGTAALGSQA